jgi:hypothetical protein
VVAVVDGAVVTVAISVVAVDKAKRAGSLPAHSFVNFTGERGGKPDLLRHGTFRLCKVNESSWNVDLALQFL